MKVRAIRSDYKPMKGHIVGVKICGFKKDANVNLQLHWNGGMETQELYKEISKKLNA